MNSRLMVWFRNLLRNLGVLGFIRKIQGMPGAAQRKKYAEEYERTKPAVMDLPEVPVPLKFHPIDAEHYADLMTRREPKVMDAIKALAQPGDTVWDIGANVGYFTILLAKLVGPGGRVIAYEPDNGSHAELLHNASLNDLHNISTLQVALGDAEGELQLFSDSKPHSGVHRLEAPRGDATGASRVPVKTGSAVVAANMAPLPNMLKIDVEGAEEKVLHGLKDVLKEPACRAIVMEVHFAQLAAQGRVQAPVDMAAYLKELGFKNQYWADASHLVAMK
jgi:FkbM family methyltransferase